MKFTSATALLVLAATAYALPQAVDDAATDAATVPDAAATGAVPDAAVSGEPAAPDAAVSGEVPAASGEAAVSGSGAAPAASGSASGSGSAANPSASGNATTGEPDEEEGSAFAIALGKAPFVAAIAGVAAVLL